MGDDYKTALAWYLERPTPKHFVASNEFILGEAKPLPADAPDWLRAMCNRHYVVSAATIKFFDEG